MHRCLSQPRMSKLRSFEFLRYSFPVPLVHRCPRMQSDNHSLNMLLNSKLIPYYMSSRRQDVWCSWQGHLHSGHINPKWQVAVTLCRATGDASMIGEPIVLVLNDLGSAIMSQQLTPYAEQDKLHVKAYADLAYAGFGVRPLSKHEMYRFFIPRPPTRIAQCQNDLGPESLCESTLRNPSLLCLDVYVATKDLQFQSLKAHLKRTRCIPLRFAQMGSIAHAHWRIKWGRQHRKNMDGYIISTQHSIVQFIHEWRRACCCHLGLVA